MCTLLLLLFLSGFLGNHILIISSSPGLSVSQQTFQRTYSVLGFGHIIWAMEILLELACGLATLF